MARIFTFFSIFTLFFLSVSAQSSISLVYPNGGETLTQGSNIWISWQGTFSGTVDLFFSEDNGGNWVTIDNNVSGNGYYWEVPVLLSNQCLIRVESDNLTDESDSAFTIIEPLPNSNSIVVDSISPPVFCQQDTFNVYFTANGTFAPANTFVLQLSDASGSFNSTTFLGMVYGQSSGVIQGFIPGYVNSGNAYRLRVIASDLYTIGTDNGSDLSLNGVNFDFEADTTFRLIPNGGVNFTFLGNTSQVNTYTWNFDDGSPSTNAPSVFHNFTQVDYYDVTLTVEATNGCITTLEKDDYIRVEEQFPCTMLVTQTNENLVGVAFANNDRGCFASETGNCFVTVDGGQNFSVEPTGMFQITGVSVIPGHWFLAGSNGQIKYSADMGQTWSLQTTNPVTTDAFKSIQVSASNAGFAVGENGMIYRFDGSSWTSENSGVTEDINSVFTIAGETYAVGNLGTILNNGGGMWASQNSGVSTKLTGVWFISPDSGMVCSTEGMVLATMDGGLNWNIVLDGVEQDFNSVSATNDTFYVAGNSGVIYQTFDFGSTWSRFSTGNTNAANNVYLKARRGWVAGSAGNGLTFGLAGFVPSYSGEIFRASGFYASPNPFEQTINLSVNISENQPSQIEILDVAGRLVYSLQNPSFQNGKLTIDATGFQQGTYLVKFQSENFTKTSLLVKQ